MVPETLTELLDCKDGSPQEDAEVERGHMDWECTEVGHVDKTNLSCRRTLDLSPEGDQRKTSCKQNREIKDKNINGIVARSKQRN